VGRGLEELGVTLIPAGSPQAKGRIERLWGTLQERLVNELRLKGAKKREQAQAVLEYFLPKYNRKFSKREGFRCGPQSTHPDQLHELSS